jgi:hypothetical protein
MLPPVVQEVDYYRQTKPGWMNCVKLSFASIRPLVEVMESFQIGLPTHSLMQSPRQKYLLFWFVLKSLKGLIRNATASSIKILIGREAYFNQNERFLIDYVAYKLGLGSEIKLTASCLPREGARMFLRCSLRR